MVLIFANNFHLVAFITLPVKARTSFVTSVTGRMNQYPACVNRFICHVVTPPTYDFNDLVSINSALASLLRSLQLHTDLSIECQPQPSQLTQLVVTNTNTWTSVLIQLVHTKQTNVQTFKEIPLRLSSHLPISIRSCSLKCASMVSDYIIGFDEAKLIKPPSTTSSNMIHKGVLW